MTSFRIPLSALAAGLLLAPLVLTLVAAPASAVSPGVILTIDLGTPEGPAALQAIGWQPCSATATTSCYDLVSPAQFASDPFLFSGRQVLFVGWTEFAVSPAINALNSRAADINNFVLGGGAVVALSEYSLGQFQWVPQGNSITLFQEHLNDIVITPAGASHPIMAGLTSASLSNWGNSRHNYLTSYPPYLNVISTATNANKAVNLAGHYGAGCVALIGQDPDWHTQYGGVAAAMLLLDNAIDWGLKCHCDEDPCQPALMVRGRNHPRDSGVAVDRPFDHASTYTLRPSYGLTWTPVLDRPVSVETPLEVSVAPGGLVGLDRVVPVDEALAPVVGPPSTVPKFYGTTTVDLTLCDCLLRDLSMKYTVVNDVAPVGDAIGPVLTQTGPHTWRVSAADTDTYRIVITAVLYCDGVATTLTFTYDQWN